MTEQAISPLRRRMIEDMSIRKFAAKTQHDYVQRVKGFATFLNRSPGTAEAEDVRRFRLHLTSSGAGTPKINATVVHRENECAERGEISLEAAAQIMDVSVMTALRMVRHGIIKGRQVCRGAPWVIKAEDVAAYRAAHASRCPLTDNPAQQSFDFQ